MRTKSLFSAGVFYSLFSVAFPSYAVADTANDTLCILTTLKQYQPADPRAGTIRSISLSAPPDEYKTAAPIMSRMLEIKVQPTTGGAPDWKLYYICTTEPGQQPVVKLFFTTNGVPY